MNLDTASAEADGRGRKVPTCLFHLGTLQHLRLVCYTLAVSADAGEQPALQTMARRPARSPLSSTRASSSLATSTCTMQLVLYVSAPRLEAPDPCMQSVVSRLEKVAPYGMLEHAYACWRTKKVYKQIMRSHGCQMSGMPRSCSWLNVIQRNCSGRRRAAIACLRHVSASSAMFIL